MLFTSAGGAFNKRSNLLPVDGLPSPLLARRPALTPLTGVRTGDVVSPRLLPLRFMRRERLAGLGDEELESRPDLRVSGDVFKCGAPAVGKAAHMSSFWEEWGCLLLAWGASEVAAAGV